MSQAGWPEPILCVITDPRAHARTLVDRCEAAVVGGADMIQLRARGHETRQVWSWAGQLAAICRAHDSTFLLNDRVDVAAACRADGCHLPEQGLPVPVARHLLPEGALIGVSTHSLAAATEAAAAGADYLFFGHIFASASKPGLQPRGLDTLRQIVRHVQIPVVAIGGIDAGNVGRVLAAGAAGAAVIAAVMHADDPAQAAARLKEAMT